MSVRKMWSGVRLRSLSGGHTDLNMVISELKDIRQAAKAFMTAQNSASQDMLKWASVDQNRAIQDVMVQLAELNNIWTDVQKEFIEHLKSFKYQFEMILEGERQVDQARNHLAACEQREAKVRKELKRAAKKASTEEINNLEIKLSQAERAKDSAHLEMMDTVQENEAIKLIRLKDGLLKLSDAYIELANKCAIIFEAQKEIAHQIPDVHNRELQDIKYTGSGATKQSVMKARLKVQQYQRHSYRLIPSSPVLEDPPPPYTPGFYDPLTGRPYDDGGGGVVGSGGDNQFGVNQRQRAVPHNLTTIPTSPHLASSVFTEATRRSPPYPSAWNTADVRWMRDTTNVDDLSNAMGAAKIE